MDNALSVLRECVAARSSWRPKCLVHLMTRDATDVIGNTLVRRLNGFDDNEDDRGLICAFWILSALATKGKQSKAKRNAKRVELKETKVETRDNLTRDVKNRFIFFCRRQVQFANSLLWRFENHQPRFEAFSRKVIRPLPRASGT